MVREERRICGELGSRVAVRNNFLKTSSGLVAVIATALMIVISALAAPGSTYRFSFIFLSALMWMVYAARHKLCLGAGHLALFASALLLHDLGVFGFYRRAFFGLSFDTYVHFYFGVVGSVMLAAGLSGNYGLRSWRLWLAVTVGLLGCGAIHELIEWASTLALGPERGMLKALKDDPYDTQKDLLNNLLGAWVGLLIAPLFRRGKLRQN